MSLRFARPAWISKQRIALLVAFVLATSMSMVVAPHSSASAPNACPGYWLANSSGAVSAYGGAASFGPVKSRGSTAAVVGIASSPDAGGYWLVASNGKVLGFGDAQLFGSMVGKRLTKPIVGIASAPDGRGYWLVAADGGVFAFGDARYFGSAGTAHLKSPVVAMAVSPDGSGYWLVAQSGSILRFGDVPFHVSSEPVPLGSKVVGMASTPDAQGYWLVTQAGKVMAFGDARYYGSLKTSPLDATVAGIAPTPNGQGYWLSARDGGVYGFGNAEYLGSSPTQVVVENHNLSATEPQRVTGIAVSFNPTHRHGHNPPRSTTTTSGNPAGATTGTTVVPTTAASSTTDITQPPTTVQVTTTTTQPTTTTTQATTTTTATTGQTCTDPVFETSAPFGIYTSGNYNVYNNMWNDSAPPATGLNSQQLYVCSPASWYVTSDQPATTDVKTYPNVQENFSSVPVSQFSTLTSSFAETDPHVGDYEDAYDMWLNGVASSGSNEVMIWNENYNQTPAGSPEGTVTFDGVTYTAWTTSDHSYIAFVANSNFTAGTVNLLEFYDWLISQGWISASSVVDQIDYGVEICSTDSAPATFQFTNFSINAAT